MKEKNNKVKHYEKKSYWIKLKRKIKNSMRCGRIKYPERVVEI